jgi:hypothetical protein
MFAENENTIVVMSYPFLVRTEFNIQCRISDVKIIDVRYRYMFLPVRVRYSFAYNEPMTFGFPPIERRLFVVTCKRCCLDVPSGRDEFPFQSAAVECPLCGELRRYLPSEVFLGRPDQLVTRQRRAGGR